MKNFATAAVGLVLMAALTACGGSDPEADARAELEEMGFSDDLTSCVIDELKKEVGDLSEFTDLSSSEQTKLGATAGAACADSISGDDLDDVLEGVDADLTDPQMRSSVITGMTSQGVSEDVANCIVDEAISQDLELSEFADEAIIGPIALACQ